jgi:hypothetical protein
MTGLICEILTAIACTAMWLALAALMLLAMELIDDKNVIGIAMIIMMIYTQTVKARCVVILAFVAAVSAHNSFDFFALEIWHEYIMKTFYNIINLHTHGILGGGWHSSPFLLRPRGLECGPVKQIFSHIFNGEFLCVVKVPEYANTTQSRELDWDGIKATPVYIDAIMSIDELDTIRYLVNQGADLRVKNGAALRWAISNRRVDLVRYIISSNRHSGSAHISGALLLVVREHNWARVDEIISANFSQSI